MRQLVRPEARKAQEIKKYCPRCEKWLVVSAFYQDKSRGDGRHPYCRVCKQKERRDSYHANPRRILEQNRRSYLKKQFGMTPEEFDQMLAKQHGLCAICGKSTTWVGKRLAIDHNSKTGKVRALLCSRCNTRSRSS